MQCSSKSCFQISGSPNETEWYSTWLSGCTRWLYLHFCTIKKSNLPTTALQIILSITIYSIGTLIGLPSITFCQTCSHVWETGRLPLLEEPMTLQEKSYLSKVSPKGTITWTILATRITLFLPFGKHEIALLTCVLYQSCPRRMGLQGPAKDPTKKWLANGQR